MQRTAILAGITLLLATAGCGGNSATSSSQSHTATNLSGKTYTTYDEASAAAKQANKPILLVAYQGNPDSIDMMLLSDPGIAERSSKMVVAKLDAKTQGATLSKLGITAYPTVMVLKPDGTPSWTKQGASPMQVIPVLDRELGVAPAQ